MASIYEIPIWEDNQAVFRVPNDIVSATDGGTTRFYYALDTPSVLVSHLPDPDGASGPQHWGGYTTFDNKKIPHFFWIPSFSPTISTEPTVKSVKFGDGYEQRTPEGINTRLLKVSLVFDKRSEKETAAIAHFLHERGGAEAFAHLPPSPYSSMKKFICRKWDVTMNFNNNYTIKVDLEEVVS